MNSEELEQSLRAEYEGHLKGVHANFRGDVTEFQKQIEAEFEKHKSLLDEAFRGFASRFDAEPEYEPGFRESVVEHLRLARDDGAKITATAIAEAEEIEKASSPVVNLNDLKDAVNDICSKDSQSSILKSLIEHASKYTPRGAFFIIKNEHFVGWKVFGKETSEGETAVRDIHFPVSADSILGGAVKSLGTVEGSFGTYGADGEFLDPLEFGRPDRMYAIPLVARGRGVAVLYSDYGHEGVTVNTDALEMLVRVAGLTVELHASSKVARVETQPETTTDFADAQHDGEDAHTAKEFHGAPAEGFHPAAEKPYTESHAEEPHAAEEDVVHHHVPDGEVESPAAVGDHSVAEVTGSDFAFAEPVPETPTHDFAFASDFGMAPEYMPAATKQEHLTPESFETAEFESTHPIADGETVEETAVPKLVEKDVSHELQSLESVSTVEPEIEKGLFAEPSIETSGAESETKFDEALVTEPAIVFDSPPADEAHDFESSPFDQTVAQFEPAGFSGGGHVPVATAPMVEAIASKPAGSRLSDRHVDLPIEVAEDERRLHNDARRFARLLVSEIKLYNEKKVQDGREASNLYEVLREAIDRSREMYDKRVQPPVASKFDYFHYELVNSLADGEESRLGSVYKGATV